jgi:hypothetical protein
MVTPESAVKTKAKKILEAYETYFFMPATGGYGRSGVPDIVGCYRGYFFAIECKAGRGKTTALQDRELRNIRNAGGVCVCYQRIQRGTITGVARHAE